MAKRVKQFRYYSDKETTKNSSTIINKATLSSGSVFANVIPILQLGIQSLPGTQFYLNNSSDPIIIGSTGIYDLELAGETEITALKFSNASVGAIENNTNAYLIIDVIYDDRED